MCSHQEPTQSTCRRCVAVRAPKLYLAQNAVLPVTLHTQKLVQRARHFLPVLGRCEYHVRTQPLESRAVGWVVVGSPSKSYRYIHVEKLEAKEEYLLGDDPAPPIYFSGTPQGTSGLSPY